SFLLFFLPLPPPPTSTPFPYTTLFRSVGLLVVAVGFVAFMATPPIQRESFKKALSWLGWAPVVPVAVITAIVLLRAGGGTHALRSEEHTSELQSRFDLVCRLLLEKKNR